MRHQPTLFLDRIFWHLCKIFMRKILPQSFPAPLTFDLAHQLAAICNGCILKWPRVPVHGQLLQLRDQVLPWDNLAKHHVNTARERGHLYTSGRESVGRKGDLLVEMWRWLSGAKNKQQRVNVCELLLKGFCHYLGLMCWSLHEKLRAIGILATISHWEEEGLVVLQGEVFIWKSKNLETFSGNNFPGEVSFRTRRCPLTLKSPSVDRFTSSAIFVRKIPSLDHEILHDTMKNHPGVVKGLPGGLPEALFTRAQCPEVLSRLGGNISKQFKHNSTRREAPNGDVEETSRPGGGTPLSLVIRVGVYCHLEKWFLPYFPCEQMNNFASTLLHGAHSASG